MLQAPPPGRSSGDWTTTACAFRRTGTGVQDVSDLGEDHAVPINPLVNDRLEVICGPAGLRYGSQAIGGGVSAENNRIPTFIS